MASVKMNNSIRFMANIEELVQRTKMTYIDAVIHFNTRHYNDVPFPFRSADSLCSGSSLSLNQ